MFREPPEALIKKEFLSRYKNWREQIWYQLVALNMRLYLYNELKDLIIFISYPPQMVYMNYPLLPVVLSDFLQVSCIIACKLGAKREELSFPSFSKRIKENIKKTDKRREFERLLVERYDILESNTNEKARLFKDIKELRDKWFAHFDEKYYLSQDIRTQKQLLKKLHDLSFNLNVLLDHFKDWFDFICFGESGSFPLLPIVYSENYVGPPNDVQILKREIITRSWIFNLPDEDPEYWQYCKEKILDPSEVQIIEKYRKIYKRERRMTK